MVITNGFWGGFVSGMFVMLIAFFVFSCFAVYLSNRKTPKRDSAEEKLAQLERLVSLIKDLEEMGVNVNEEGKKWGL
jgi:membrane protein implicated in regulation of membrane protease activity